MLEVRRAGAAGSPLVHGRAGGWDLRPNSVAWPDGASLVGLVVAAFLGNPYGASPAEVAAAERALPHLDVRREVGDLVASGAAQQALRLLLAASHRRGALVDVDAATWRALPRPRALCVRLITAAARARAALDDVVGSSAAMGRVRALAWSAAFGADLMDAMAVQAVLRGHDVLLRGETGTGKDVIARALQAACLGPEDGTAAPQSTINARGHPRDARGERAVRPREGRVHRRGRATGRAFEVRTGGTCSSTRWASFRRNPGEAAARARAGRGERVGGRRAPRRRRALRPATNRDLSRGRGGALPRRTSIIALRARAHACPRCASGPATWRSRRRLLLRLSRRRGVPGDGPPRVPSLRHEAAPARRVARQRARAVQRAAHGDAGAGPRAGRRRRRRRARAARRARRHRDPAGGGGLVRAPRAVAHRQELRAGGPGPAPRPLDGAAARARARGLTARAGWRAHGARARPQVGQSRGTSVNGTSRITLAPIVVLAGFVFEIWAIMKKPGNREK